ncbi:MAG: hypothetical protein HEQ35_02250 [Gloeotrichia echinulata IR180]|nr:hypothetical protein [Gloeotrichia echinulata DEX184]
MIGSPIAKDFLEKLKSNPNIGQVIVINLTEYGDEIYAGMSFTELDHVSIFKLLKDQKIGWGHFYYAPPNNDEGTKRRRDLAKTLWESGLR